MVKKPNVRKEMFPIITAYIENLKKQEIIAKSVLKAISSTIRQQERGLANLQKRYNEQ